MRIGLTSIYSFRPHVEHMYYVATMLKQAGHEVFFLTCDSSLENCYARALKGTSKITECSKCIIGSIRSYPTENIQSLDSNNSINLDISELENIASSSTCTIIRTESDKDTLENEYRELRKTFYNPIETTYGSAINWIQKNNLEAVICFNGRMEVTRSITYACEKLNIPYLTQERTWFSDGLQFVPNANCLSLKEVNKLNIKYRDAFLTDLQARRSAKLIASRFAKINLGEWRAYNLNSTKSQWPIKNSSGLKVLILPSSRNEFQGHPEWNNLWQNNTAAFDWVLKELKIDYGNVVLRCHPNWGENIGKNNGSRSENYYTQWSKVNGIHYIPSQETANTFDLIQECDILIVNGSSAAFEAGACGKKIICLGHSAYEEAGIAIHLFSEDDKVNLKSLLSHDPIDVIRKTLRHGYTMSRRFAQFVDFVKAKSSTQYNYYNGADADRIIKMLKTGSLNADDSSVADSSLEEDEVVSLLLNKEWAKLASFSEPQDKPLIKIHRRALLIWIDKFRDFLPRGDL